LERIIDPVGDTVSVGFVLADLEAEGANHAVRSVEGVSHPLHGDWSLVHEGDVVVGSDDAADNDGSCLGERRERSTTSDSFNLANLGNSITVGNDELVANINR
jgi:hypothetical protein